METKIKWNEGEGYITATYDGSGNGSASVSSDVNEGIDREQSVSVETTEGGNPKSVSVNIKQIGLREVFSASDGDFILADGGTFNVLKGVESPYTFVEFIESTGTQYIDTGFTPDSATRVIVDFCFTTKRTHWQAVFGSRISPTDGGRFCFYLSNTSIFRSDYGSTNIWSSKSIEPLSRHIVDKNRNITTIDNYYVTNHNAENFNSSRTIWLFLSNQKDTIVEWAFMKLYSCKIYNNDVLIRDFVPVRVKESGEYGLLDNVNNVFYGSASNTQFIGG